MTRLSTPPPPGHFFLKPILQKQRYTYTARTPQALMLLRDLPKKSTISSANQTPLAGLIAKAAMRTDQKITQPSSTSWIAISMDEN